MEFRKVMNHVRRTHVCKFALRRSFITSNVIYSCGCKAFCNLYSLHRLHSACPKSLFSHRESINFRNMHLILVILMIVILLTWWMARLRRRNDGQSRSLHVRLPNCPFSSFAQMLFMFSERSFASCDENHFMRWHHEILPRTSIWDVRQLLAMLG